MQTILKSYSDESTDFLDKVIPKIGSQYICLAVILIDFVLEKVESYYLQVFFKKQKYIRYITDDTEISVDDTAE